MTLSHNGFLAAFLQCLSTIGWWIQRAKTCAIYPRRVFSLPE